MAHLAVYMNGYRVGTFTKTTSGAHQFQYHESWQIFPRHFYQTAKAVGFEKVQMEMILNEMASSLDEVISAVRQQLPDTFPAQIADSILDGLSTRAQRLTR
jgi:serine/threonine protein kinase HipA of HipAB toxin-antitoxin module